MTQDGFRYAVHIAELHVARERAKSLEKQKGKKRQNLSPTERESVLDKTDARCHICGGIIEGRWDADHVLAHSKGGKHSVENYLPAHKTCNNYRWDYLAEEFQEIMKLGVWVRTQIEKQTPVGREVADRFTKYEINKRRRRKNSNTHNILPSLPLL